MAMTRVRLGALALAVAGVLFVLYPAIRPYADETSLEGAEAFASNAWIVAHVLAMLGFVLVALGLLALYRTLQDTPAEGLAFFTLITTWIGVGLTLPYYGAEAFGLHAIGQEAMRQQSAALMSLANDIRYGPGIVLFGAGLVLLGLGAILAAVAVWRSGELPRWSGILFGLAFALFIPQFFGSPVIRVTHGLLMAVGCVWLAFAICRAQESRRNRARSARTAGSLLDSGNTVDQDRDLRSWHASQPHLLGSRNQSPKGKVRVHGSFALLSQRLTNCAVHHEGRSAPF